MKDVKCMQEGTYLDKFFETLSSDQNRCCYGQKSVQYALDNQAIETLLVSDKLFRSKNTTSRKFYV